MFFHQVVASLPTDPLGSLVVQVRTDLVRKMVNEDPILADPIKAIHLLTSLAIMLRPSAGGSSSTTDVSAAATEEGEKGGKGGKGRWERGKPPANACKRCNTAYCQSTDSAGTNCLVFGRPPVDMKIGDKKLTSGIIEFAKLCRLYAALTGKTNLKNVSISAMRATLKDKRGQRDQAALVDADLNEIDVDTRLVIAATTDIGDLGTSLDAVTEPEEFKAWLECDEGEVCAALDTTSSESGDVGSTPMDPYSESAPVPEEMSDVTNPDELNAWLEGCGVYVAGTPLPIHELIAPTTTVPTSEPMIPCSKFEKGSILINPLMSSHPLPCAKCSELCGYSSEGKCVCYLGSPNSPDSSSMHDCNDSDASGDEDAIPSGMNASTAIEHSNQSVCALEDGDAQSLGEILPHVAKELSEVAKQLETIAITSSSTHCKSTGPVYGPDTGLLVSGPVYRTRGPYMDWPVSRGPYLGSRYGLQIQGKKKT